jgi:predicted PurR-regulated permease PerM
MQGQFLLGALVAVLVFLGLTLLGFKHALLLAVLAGIFEIIPLFGPILSAIPAIIVGFADGGVATGLLVTGLYVVIQQFENHLIYPLVVNKVVGISPVFVIIALLVGGKLAGFIGILLAVPVSTVLVEYYLDIQREKQRTPLA